MRSNLFCRNITKKLFTKKKGRPKPPPGTRLGIRERNPPVMLPNVGRDRGVRTHGPCGYDPAKCEGRSNESIPSLRSAGCVWLEHMVPGPRRQSLSIRSASNKKPIPSIITITHTKNSHIIILFTLI